MCVKTRRCDSKTFRHVATSWELWLPQQRRELQTPRCTHHQPPPVPLGLPLLHSPQSRVRFWGCLLHQPPGNQICTGSGDWPRLCSSAPCGSAGQPAKAPRLPLPWGSGNPSYPGYCFTPVTFGTLWRFSPGEMRLFTVNVGCPQPAVLKTLRLQ